MNPEESFGLGSLLAVTGWWLARRVAGAGLGSPAALLLDASLPSLAFTALLASTARPVFSGAVTLALAAGFAFSDRRKRHILNEPIVISDVFLALDIFRHPTLALPFPDTARVLGGAGLAVATFVAMFVLEPPVGSWSPWPALLMAGALGGALWALARPLDGGAGGALRPPGAQRR